MDIVKRTALPRAGFAEGAERAMDSEETRLFGEATLRPVFAAHEGCPKKNSSILSVPSA